jgi:hypothetical protein
VTFTSPVIVPPLVLNFKFAVAYAEVAVLYVAFAKSYAALACAYDAFA